MHDDSMTIDDSEDRRNVSLGSASRELFSTSVFVTTLILSLSMCVLTVVGIGADAGSFLFGIALGLACYGLSRRAYGRRLFYKGRSWFARRGISLLTAFLVLAYSFLSPRFIPGFQDWPWGPIALGIFLTLYSVDGLFVRASNQDTH